MGRLNIYLLSLLCLLTLMVFPQQDSLFLELSLEELMKVKVHVSSSKGVDVLNSPSTVTVLTDKDINAYGFLTLSEAVQAMSGMSVTRTFLKRNLPTSRSLLQDNYANKVLVMINGISTWHGTTGEGNLDRVSIGDVERIEILKGPASVLYGTNAYSGVINIVLKNKKEDYTEVYSGVGQHNSFATGGSAVFNAKKLHVFLAANSSSFKGPKENIVDENGVKGLFTEFQSNQNYTIDAQYKSHHLFINGFSGEESFMGVENSFESGMGHPHKLQGVLMNYAFIKQVSDKTRFELSSTHDYMSRELSRTQTDALRSVVEGYRLNLKSSVVHEFSPSFEAELGGFFEESISIRYDNYIPQTGALVSDNNMNDKSVYRHSLFGQATYKTTHFVFLAGARWVHNQWYGHHVNPRATFTYLINENSSLKFIYGQSYRNPSLFELYFATPTQTVTGNPYLKPEQSKSLELSYQKKVNKLYIELLAYQGFYYNTIYRSSDSTITLPNGYKNTAQRNIYINGDVFDAYGIESSVRYVNPAILSGFFVYNYVVGSAYHHQPTNPHYNFKYIPKHTLSMGLTKKITPKWVASLIGQYKSSVTSVFEPIEAQYLIDATLSYAHYYNQTKLTHHLACKNITNSAWDISEYVRHDKVNQLSMGYYRTLFYTLTLKF